MDRRIIFVGSLALAIVGVRMMPSPCGQAAEIGITLATHLHLSADGSVQVPPDLLVADLVASATSASPAVAQRAVNTLMLHGLNAAKGVTGVDARAMDYSVDPVDLNEPLLPTSRPLPRRSGWTAQQTLELRSPAGEQLLDLVGKLQGEGLAVGSLGWQLSPALGDKARNAAMVEALKALRSRAAAAASTLGLEVDHLQDVRVDMPEVFPVRPMMAMAARMGPPSATASPQFVSSQVTAEVIVRQKELLVWPLPAYSPPPRPSPVPVRPPVR